MCYFNSSLAWWLVEWIGNTCGSKTITKICHLGRKQSKGKASRKVRTRNDRLRTKIKSTSFLYCCSGRSTWRTLARLTYTLLSKPNTVLYLVWTRYSHQFHADIMRFVVLVRWVWDGPAGASVRSVAGGQEAGITGLAHADCCHDSGLRREVSHYPQDLQSKRWFWQWCGRENHRMIELVILKATKR